jgi:hypothetical protein
MTFQRTGNKCVFALISPSGHVHSPCFHLLKCTKHSSIPLMSCPKGQKAPFRKYLHKSLPRFLRSGRLLSSSAKPNGERPGPSPKLRLLSLFSEQRCATMSSLISEFSRLSTERRGQKRARHWISSGSASQMARCIRLGRYCSSRPDLKFCCIIFGKLLKKPSEGNTIGTDGSGS